LFRRFHVQAFLVAIFFVLAVTALAGFGFKVYQFNQSAQKMKGLTRTLNNLAAVKKVDLERQQQLQKIMNIMDRYNPEMASNKKYEIAEEIYNMTKKYANLNVDLVCATITHESALTWRPDVKSHAGAMGLMQIMPATGILLAAEENIPWTTPEGILYDPIINIRLGCRYLSNLIVLYDLDGGLAAYNGGEKRAAMWLASGRDDRILWEETRGYIPAVLKLYEQFRN
jgi:soluble lytic murein transglycosylase